MASDAVIVAIKKLSPWLILFIVVAFCYLHAPFLPRKVYRDKPQLSFIKKVTNPNPVILLPGDGGNQVEAKLNKTHSPHYFCSKKTNYWYDLWVNVELLGPFFLDCFIDNMRLEYNNKTRRSSSPEGVKIRFPGFGNTSSMDFLDPSHLSPTSYFQSISDALVAAGLVRGLSLRGAPYDFRLGPSQQDDFFKALKKLIEETFYLNAKHRVILVAHSMGNVMSHLFLTQQTQSWKDKFIHSLVGLAPPWGGSVKTLKVMSSGDNLGIFIVNTFKSRQYQRTLPSVAWLMPKPTFWGPDEVLLSTQKRNYTVTQYKDLFYDMGWPTGWEMYKDEHQFGMDLKPPGVRVHCIYGVNVSTSKAFQYSYWFPFPDNKPYAIVGDGDGTVNIRSLEGWTRWVGKQPHSVSATPRPHVNHLAILDDAETVKQIVNFATTPEA